MSICDPSRHVMVAMRHRELCSNASVYTSFIAAARGLWRATGSSSSTHIEEKDSEDGKSNCGKPTKSTKKDVAEG